MRVKMIMLLALVMALMTSVLSGPAVAAKPAVGDPNGTLRIARIGNGTVWDPHTYSASEGGAWSFLAPLYDGLLRLTSDLSPAPMLAKSYNLSADKRTLTMDLRSGVVFQDGTPFDAAAVVANFAYEKTLNNPLVAEPLSIISSVTAVNSMTVRFDLSADGTRLPLQMAQSVILSGMASPKALGSPAALATAPVGAGPYKLVANEQSSSTYEKWDGYWDKAYLKRAPQRVVITTLLDDNARLAALQAGQVDMIPILAPLPDLASVADGKTIKLFNSPVGGRFLEMHLNYTRNPALANPQVRAALNLAIDRKGIDTAVMAGQCPTSNQPAAKSQGGYATKAPAPKYDPVKAKQMLAAAGFPTLTLKALTIAQQPYQNFATAMQAQLAKVGVTVDITVLASTITLSTWRSGSYDAFFVASSNYPDPAQVISDSFTQNPVRLPFSTNPAVSGLLAQVFAKPVGDPARDVLLQKTALEIVKDPSPSLIVCQWPIQYLYRSNVLGVEKQTYGQLNLLSDFRFLEIKKS